MSITGSRSYVRAAFSCDGSFVFLTVDVGQTWTIHVLTGKMAHWIEGILHRLGCDVRWCYTRGTYADAVAAFEASQHTTDRSLCIYAETDGSYSTRPTLTGDVAGRSIRSVSIPY